MCHTDLRVHVNIYTRCHSIVLYCIALHCLVSYHVVSYHITSQHITVSYHVILYSICFKICTYSVSNYILFVLNPLFATLPLYYIPSLPYLLCTSPSLYYNYSLQQSLYTAILSLLKLMCI